jgi:hypothetical protein
MIMPEGGRNRVGSNGTNGIDISASYAGLPPMSALPIPPEAPTEGE